MKKTAALFAFIALAAAAYILLSHRYALSRSLISKERINIIIIGCDDLHSIRHADAVIVASYEPRTGFLDILTIPRDTKVPCPREYSWRGYRKLCDMYAVSYRKTRSQTHAISVVQNSVEEVTGMDIPYYVQVSYDVFRDVIDIIGGVDVTVEEPMHYDDVRGGLHIHFDPGVHRMDGRKALEYVRYRDRTHADIGRSRRQQYFLRLVLERMNNVRAVVRIPGIINAFRRHVHTNLSLWDMMQIFNEAKDIRSSNVRFQLLPGEPQFIRGDSYWVIDRILAEEAVSVILNSYWMTQKHAPLISRETFDTSLTIEVWNASDHKGAAYRVQRSLRKYGIDTVRYGNFGAHRKYTVVIDRKGNIANARKLARIIGCRDIRTEVDQSRMVDASLIIGRDFMDMGYLSQ